MHKNDNHRKLNSKLESQHDWIQPNCNSFALLRYGRNFKLTSVLEQCRWIASPYSKMNWI